MAIGMAGSIIAGITTNERYHQFWAIFFPFARSPTPQSFS
jgi:hypothetical protein